MKMLFPNSSAPSGEEINHRRMPRDSFRCAFAGFWLSYPFEMTRIFISFSYCYVFKFHACTCVLDLSLREKNIDWGCLSTGCRGEYLDLRGRKWQEDGEHYIMRSFITCTLHRLLFVWQIGEDCDRQAWSTQSGQSGNVWIHPRMWWGFGLDSSGWGQKPVPSSWTQ